MAEVTHAQSNLNTVLGALGTAAFAGISANGNGLGILGGNKTEYATKADLDNAIIIASKDSEIALLKAESNTESKMIDVYERVMARVNADRNEQLAWNTQQLVNNSQMASAIAVNANSISALQTMCNSLTKVVIPNTSVCPGWGTATVTVSSGASSGGTTTT